MYNTWLYIDNDLLLTIYKKAVEQKLDGKFIEMTFNEIKHRNLRIDQPRNLKPMV